MKTIGDITYYGMFNDETISVLETFSEDAEVRYLWHDNENFNFDKTHGWFEHRMTGGVLYLPETDTKFHPQPKSDIPTEAQSFIDRYRGHDDPPNVVLQEFPEICLNLRTKGTLPKYEPFYKVTVKELLAHLKLYPGISRIIMFHESSPGIWQSLKLERIIYDGSVIYLKPRDSFYMDSRNDYDALFHKAVEWEKENPDHIQIIKTI